MADRNANASDAPPAQIDVLIAYTPAAKAAVGDMNLTIAQAVANTNAAFGTVQSSQVQARHVALSARFKF